MATTKKTAAATAILKVRPMRRQKREPDYEKVYPWAVNVAKIKRAHAAISDENDQLRGRGKQPLEGADFEQAVIDHYTAHAGLVRGHENLTIVGRRGAMKKNFALGKTTNDVLGTDPTKGKDDDVDDNVEEDMPASIPEDLPTDSDDE